MSEPCTVLELGAFTLYHHRWGPWIPFLAPDNKRMITRKCLVCTKIQQQEDHSGDYEWSDA